LTVGGAAEPLALRGIQALPRVEKLRMTEEKENNAKRGDEVTSQTMNSASP